MQVVTLVVLGGDAAATSVSLWHAIAGAPCLFIGVIVLIYDIIMTILALQSKLNHSLRLLVVSIY